MKTIKLFFVFFFLALSGSALETTIKGGKMELLNKGETVLFQEGVHLKRGTDSLKANEMETNKKRDKVHARGKVKFFRRINSSETIQGFGKKGFYNTTTGEGFLLSGFRRAHLIYKNVFSSTQTRRVDIYSKRLDFSRDKSRAWAKKKVYGKTVDPETNEEYEFWAEEAEYFGAEKKLILTGTPQPRVHQTLGNEKKLISGDKIIYYIGPRRFITDGSAQAIFIEDNKEE